MDDIYRIAYLKTGQLYNKSITRKKNTIAFTDFAWIAHTFFDDNDLAVKLYPIVEDEFNNLIKISQNKYGMYLINIFNFFLLN